MDARNQAKHNLGRRAFAEGDPRKSVVMPYVQFFANSSFANEEQNRVGYTLTLKNTGANAEDRQVAICPAYFGTAVTIQTADGDSIDAIVADGEIIAEVDKVVTCVGSPQPVERFLHFVKSHPTRITQMQMKVSDPAQFDEDIKVSKLVNFSRLEAGQSIMPSAHIDPTFSNDKLIKFSVNHLQFDEETVVYFKLLAGMEVTFKFFPGATINEAANLESGAAAYYEANEINREK